MFRVGFGQDSHKFSCDQERKLMLGGVEVPGEPGLDGNSDADVVIHALCRALEQAIAGDSFFIYADKLHAQGINDSLEYLKIAKQHIAESGFIISNIGLSLECQRPKIIPIADAIRQTIADTLEIDISQVGINATSGEGMTPFGRGEGIQTFAIVSLIKI